MGIIEVNDGYILFTYNLRKVPTEKTYELMATKIQKWWRTMRYKFIIKKAYMRRFAK